MDGPLLVGNMKPCQIFGLRDIILEMPDGINLVLVGVKNVLEVRRNLISLGAFDEIGYSIMNGKGCLRSTNMKRLY